MKMQNDLFRYSLLLLLANCCFLISLQAQNIVKAEYFLDTDPGFGLATNIPVTPAADIANLNFNVPIGALQPGFHTLFTRVKDANGKWSLTNHKTFYKETISAIIPNIVKVEYFIDTDPGFGSGTNVPVSPGTDLANLAFTVNLASLQPGFHNIYTRAKDANGKWSLTNVKTFYKEVVPVNLPNIVKAEYFIDIDPGFGIATNIPITAATDISNLQFAINISSLSVGSHTLFVRAKDANGKWSLTNMKAFNVCNGPAAPTVTPTVTYCQGATATALTATGTGLLWYTASTGGTGSTSAPTPLTTSPGTFEYYVSQSAGGCESTRATITVQVNAIPAQPTISTSGGMQTLTSSSTTGNQWQLNGVNIPGATSQTYSPTQTGSYTVVVTVNGCSNTSAALVITGTSEALAAKDLLVYPNPNQGKFRLELNNFEAGMAELTVTDLVGKTILKKEIRIRNGKVAETVELQANKGNYLLQVKADNQIIIRKVMVE